MAMFARRSRILCMLGLLLGFVVSAARAQEAPVVRSILFVGNEKMRTSRLLQYMDTKIGAAFDEEVFRRDIERITSWMYFDEVRPEVVSSPEGVDIVVHLTEKWTVVPEVDVQYGGGVLATRLGMKDTNFLGYRQEAMFYGGWRANEWLAGARFIEPRIAGSRFGLWTHAERQFYADPVFVGADDVRPEYALVVERLGGEIRVERELDDIFRVGLTAKYSRDRLETAEDSRSDAPPPGLGFEMPERATVIGPGVWAKLGRVAVDHYIYRGWSLETLFYEHRRAWGSSEDFERVQGDLRWYVPAWTVLNITGRFFAGFENSGEFVEQYTLGGLDTLRGYPDRRYRGRASALGNFELRYLSVTWWWFTSMFVASSDVGTTWSYGSDEWNADDHLHVSAGPGYRCIVNKWDYAVIRLDYAWPLTEDMPPGVTFGMDMFF